MVSPNEGWFIIILGIPSFLVLCLFYLRLRLLGKRVDFVQQSAFLSGARTTPTVNEKDLEKIFPLALSLAQESRLKPWGANSLSLYVWPLAAHHRAGAHRSVWTAVSPQKLQPSKPLWETGFHWQDYRNNDQSSPPAPRETIRNLIQEPSAALLIGHRFDRIASHWLRHAYEAWSNATGPFRVL